MGWGEGFVKLYERRKKTTCQNRLLYDPLAVTEGEEVNLHQFHPGHKLYISNLFRHSFLRLSLNILLAYRTETYTFHCPSNPPCPPEA